MSLIKKKSQKIRISLCGYDHRVVDRATQEIIEIATCTGVVVIGPVPLPTIYEKFTLLTSPHVNKKAREQFQQGTHKRVLEIQNPTGATIEKLKNHNLPSGVDVNISN